MTAYYHGGVPGLGPGDRLLPPAVTGATHTLTNWAEAPGAEPDTTLRDLVYITTDPLHARQYAAIHPHGTLYRVRPHGPTTPDPAAHTSHTSWRCAEAVVEEVVEVDVPFVAITTQSRRRRRQSP